MVSRMIPGARFDCSNVLKNDLVNKSGERYLKAKKSEYSFVCPCEIGDTFCAFGEKTLNKKGVMVIPPWYAIVTSKSVDANGR